MKSGKNIDKIFQKVFEAETFSYKDEYWEDAQSALASQNGKKLGLRGLINGSKVLGISIAASVVFAAMLPFAMTSSKDEKAIAMPHVDDQLGNKQNIASEITDAGSLNSSSGSENYKDALGENRNDETYTNHSSENANGSNETLGTMNSEDASTISQNNSDRRATDLGNSNPLATADDRSSEFQNKSSKNDGKDGATLLAHMEPTSKKVTQYAAEESGLGFGKNENSQRETEENSSNFTSDGLSLGETGELPTPLTSTNSTGSEGKTEKDDASTSTEPLTTGSINITNRESNENPDGDKNDNSLAQSTTEADNEGGSNSQLSMNFEYGNLSKNVLKQGNSRSLYVPLFITDWEKGLLLESGLTLAQMPLLDLPDDTKFPAPITHKPIWTLGLETNYNVFAKNLAKNDINPYLTERANGETLQNTFGYGLHLARTTRSFTTQLGLQYGGLNENISYTSTDTIVKREFVGVRYVSRMAVDGGTVSRGETVYDTVIQDTTYAEIENHTRNSVRFLEVPVYLGKRFSYKKLGFDFGVGASWQRVIGQSGYVINNELDGLTSLDGFLSKNAFNGMAGLNADYQFAKGWRVGVSARYKVPIGALRFDSDFRLQQYNYGFSISREIF